MPPTVLRRSWRQAWHQPATYHQSKSKYGELDVSQLRRMEELETENAKLKKMYAELSLNWRAFEDVVENNGL
jgi:putative transposase